MSGNALNAEAAIVTTGAVRRGWSTPVLTQALTRHTPERIATTQEREFVPKYTVAVIGGTGPQGKGLGYRFARHGHDVVLGSRAAGKAQAVAEEVSERLALVGGTGSAQGASNADAVAAADVVLLAVPYDGHDELVASLAGGLAGKTLISCVNPLAFDKRGAHGRVIGQGESSAAESAAELAPQATVVGAFHNVSAVGLWGEDEFLDEDVIVVGDSAEAKQVAIDLATAVTSRPGVDGGQLRLSRVLEPFTALLISINRKYKTHSGIRVTGLGEQSSNR